MAAAATRLQSAFRARSCFVNYCVVLIATVDLQRGARRFLSRRRLRYLRACCVAVQRFGRGRAARSLARRLRSARALQAATRGASARRECAARVLAATVMQRTFHSKRVARQRLAASRTLQTAARLWASPHFVPQRRALLRACYQLHHHYRLIPTAMGACAALRSVCAKKRRARELSLELGAVPALLCTIGACNRSPPSLALLRSALAALELFVADGACVLRLGCHGHQLAATLIKVLISHWGSATYFEPAARCLLLTAKGSDRLRTTIAAMAEGEAAFTRRSLGERLRRALRDGKVGGKGAARARYAALARLLGADAECRLKDRLV